ncbi:hypothetical protein LIER_43232 [Lithospermum erythrorhizon]|uniref:Uncharacterized protein n=1 Tax=Lithospermum erythrorhizon TaxID=34254 RepID=A0AAV3PS02_LITER
MAGGVQTQPPPPHELMVLPSIKPSQLQSKPSLSQVFGQLHTFKAPSTVISEAQPLEDGEIPPLLSSCVPSSSGPQPYKPSLPLSYSNIVQGHKNVLPISEVNLVLSLRALRRKYSLATRNLFWWANSLMEDLH